MAKKKEKKRSTKKVVKRKIKRALRLKNIGKFLILLASISLILSTLLPVITALF